MKKGSTVDSQPRPSCTFFHSPFFFFVLLVALLTAEVSPVIKVCFEDVCILVTAYVTGHLNLQSKHHVRRDEEPSPFCVSPRKL